MPSILFVLQAQKCGPCVHVMEACTVPVGGLNSHAASMCSVHVIKEWHGYSSVFELHLFVFVNIMLKYTLLNYI